MGIRTEHIEFSEDFNTRYTGVVALQHTVKYRLSTIKGEIPYDTQSIDSYLFSRGQKSQFLNDLRRLIGDITTNVQLTMDGRVLAAGIAVPLPNTGDS